MADSAQNTPACDFAVDQLDYCLPEELIAQHPSANREDARLLVVDRAARSLRDSRITEFPSLLRPGDLLVLNDTKVVPAKFLARRRSGGKVPGLFLEEIEPGVWEVLLEGSRRLKPGESLSLLRPGELGQSPASGPSFGGLLSDSGVALQLLERGREGRWRVRVQDSRPAIAILEECGETPLPPYISRGPHARTDEVDRQRYQTVYARQPGAVAAPTAGLHLTDAILRQLGELGVQTATVTLHVGLGTFKPISAERLSDHVMHQERYEVPAGTLEDIRACRARAGRIIAVGTTTVRVLETIARLDKGIKGSRDRGIEEKVEKSKSRKVDTTSTVLRGATNIFIHPPYEFRVVDSLLTNFHLPRSTLLALVMAFAGIDLTRQAYRQAIAAKYRFYSYGDAMLII